jgi:hypothetical protein
VDRRIGLGRATQGFTIPENRLVLTLEDAEELRAIPAPLVPLLQKKVEELVRRRFTREDESLQAMFSAMTDLYRLAIALHYQTCRRDRAGSAAKTGIGALEECDDSRVPASDRSERKASQAARRDTE